MSDGSWSQVLEIGDKTQRGITQNMFALSSEFTASSTGVVPALDLSLFKTAFLTDIGIVLNGIVAPSATLVITIKDADGLTILTTDAITLSKRISVFDRPSTVGGCSINVSGNSVSGAKAKVVLYFADNIR